MLNNKTLRGQAIILIVFAIVGLIAITALAIDGGNAFADRRKAQSAADNAAMAAALASVNYQNSHDSAEAMIIANHPVNDGWVLSNPPGPGCNGATPTISLIPTANPFDLPDNINYYYQVVLRTTVDTYFGPVIGIRQLHNCVQAIARARPPFEAPVGFGNGMISLNPHDCQTFKVHGNSETFLIDGGVFVNSDCSSTTPGGAFDQSGTGGITVTGGGICAVGVSTVGNNGIVSPAPTQCTETIPYPPDWLPKVDCASMGQSNVGGNFMTPGNVAGSAFGGTITLDPGVYCIHGNTNFNAGDVIKGDGVMLYFIDGKLTINGGATVQLSALVPVPDPLPVVHDPPYYGLLIYAPITNSNPLVLNGDMDSLFTGTILAPASDVQLNGNGSTDTMYYTQVIGYTLDLIGTANTNIQYNADQNWPMPIPPSLDMVR